MTLHGLTSHDATARLKQYGFNQIVAEHRLPLIVNFLARFNNPLIIILLLAAVVSAFLGDILTFSIITAIVIISALLDFFTSYRSQQAAEDLKNRVRIAATVIRDGHKVQVPLTNLVPGDIVQLNPGNIVPADGHAVGVKDLYVNEGALTGESFPQAKPDDSQLYMGSSVTSGTGYIEVTQTGAYTKFSHIAAQLAGRQPITEFEREIRQFSRLIIIMTGFLVLAIFGFNSLFRHDLFASLLFSLALAVGLTPSLLPLIITLNLTKGSLKMAHHGVIVKKLAAIQNFGSMDVLCTDKTGTLTEDKIALVKYVDSYGNTSEEVLQFAYLASVYSSSYENPLDRAVKDFKHLSTAGWRKQDVVPFTFERKRESVAVGHKSATTLISKGAPEAIFEICNKAADGTPMDAKLRKQIHKEYDQLSSDGFRVLAIATKPLQKHKGIEAVDESGMDFHGFIAFLDPAKKSVTATLQKIEDYGVEIKIISGDNALVNQRIAEEIKLPNKGMLTGDQIDKLSAAELAQKVEQTTIFARVTPEQKLRIIQTLQTNGHVVGYMGDGINDAPSLKAADTGISVNNAVDVAKDTADMILLHKSLNELIEGVVEGRRTFANTLKYLMMALSSNFGNMFSMAGASLLLPFLPMLAPQILLNNLLYDTSQIALPTDNVDESSIKRPHRLSISGIRKFMIVFGPLSSVFDFVTFGVLLGVFHLHESSFQAGWFLESMLTQTLVVFVIRTRKVPFMQSRPSAGLIASTVFALGAAILFVTTPLAHFFYFGNIPLISFVWIVGIVLVYLGLTQAIKAAFYKHVSLWRAGERPRTSKAPQTSPHSAN